MCLFATLSFVVGTAQHLGINWTTIIEVLSSVAGLAAFVWGIIKGYQAWVNRRTRKREAEEDAEIEKKIQTVVDVALTKILGRVDDRVHATIADTMADMNKHLSTLDQKIEEVHVETHENHGSSMKDSQNRTERYVIQLLENQAANQELFIASEKRLDSVVDSIKGNSEAIATLQQDLSHHIGAHEGLPGDEE